MPGHPSCEIAGLQPGDHLCWIYRNDIEFRSFLASFLRQGLAQKERVLCILNGQTTSEFVKPLEDDGAVLNTALHCGQLIIFEAIETCLWDRCFDPERMIAYLRSEEERSLRDGYGGLRIVGDMSWALRDIHGAECLSEYEARLNEFVPNCKCLGLCQYDQRRFKADMLLDALSIHPMVAIGAELFRNPYYIPLRNLRGDDFFQARFECQIGNLIRQKRTEEALKQDEERIHMLSRQLLQAQETERRRISRELHDTIAQDLCGLKINLDTLLLDSPGQTPEERERVAKMSRAVHRSIVSVRDLAYDLHPPELENTDLVETIRRHCDDIVGRTAMGIDLLAIGIEDVRLNLDTRLALYRLVQEGLINITKHADATHVLIHLCFSAPDIILRIQDNGRGFDVRERFGAAVAERKMGLHVMRERVAMLNGEIRVESQPSLGTSILVRIPCMEGEDA